MYKMGGITLVPTPRIRRLMIDHEERDFSSRQQLVNSGQADPGRTLVSWFTVSTFRQEWSEIIRLIADTAEDCRSHRVYWPDSVQSPFRKYSDTPRPR